MSWPVDGRDAANAAEDSLGSERVRLDGHSFFHSVVPVPAQRGDESARLHILYPEEEYHRAWQREVYPPLGFVAGGAAGRDAAWPMRPPRGSPGAWAGCISRSTGSPDGDFQQFALPAGDDEIRTLAEAVNRMAAMLASYEQEVRRTERMRTLAHLGGGIAHQLRNSATGCAMAVDLHAEECPLGDRRRRASPWPSVNCG